MPPAIVTPPPSSPSPKRLLAFRLGAVCGSLLLVFAVIELAARAVSGHWSGSFLERETDLMKSAYPVAHDPRAGWIPLPGFAGRVVQWRAQVTILADGARSNGSAAPPAGPAEILALGDSFTFGAEVSDHQTWPAHLERIVSKPVCNAGVFGYGIDQMVIRGKQIMESKTPRWIVLSFIPDDIDRCELIMRGAHKPCYRLVSGALKAENQPVPPPQPREFGVIRGALGHSWLAHRALMRLDSEWWLQGTGARTVLHHDGEAVAIALLRDFSATAAERGSRLLIVAQGDSQLLPEDQAKAARVLAGLHGAAALTLDLHPNLAALRDADAQQFRSLFQTHMTSAGNEWVARRIAGRLAEENL